MEPDVNGLTRKQTKTTRRIILVRPHLTQRTPVDQAVAWRKRRRTFGLSALAWLTLGIAAGPLGLSHTFTVISLLAGVLSAAVVVKAQVLIRRSEQAQRSRPI